MLKVFEIFLEIVIVLILILNGCDCLFCMCFGICYMSGIYLIHWVYYHFVFSKKFQKLDNDLTEYFKKPEVFISLIKCREETKKKTFVNNYIPLPPSDFYTKSRLQDVLSKPSKYFANVEIKNFDIIYHDLHQKELTYPLNHYQKIFKDSLKEFDKDMTDYLLTFACRSE